MTVETMNAPHEILREPPHVVGGQHCCRCARLEHSACMGCLRLYCRDHAISALSWTPVGGGQATVSLVLCQDCLPTTIVMLEKARAHLALIAQYEA